MFPVLRGLFLDATQIGCDIHYDLINDVQSIPLTTIGLKNPRSRQKTVPGSARRVGITIINIIINGDRTFFVMRKILV